MAATVHRAGPHHQLPHHQEESSNANSLSILPGVLRAVPVPVARRGGAPMLTWDDDLHRLDVAEMDATHREFVQLVHTAAGSDAESFGDRFQALLDHTQAHFENEGRLMRESGFPALAEHEAEHRRVLADLTRMLASIRRGRPGLPRAFVGTGLAEWFNLHLGSMDAALAGHLQRVGNAPQDRPG